MRTNNSMQGGYVLNRTRHAEKQTPHVAGKGSYDLNTQHSRDDRTRREGLENG